MEAADALMAEQPVEDEWEEEQRRQDWGAEALVLAVGSHPLYPALLDVLSKCNQAWALLLPKENNARRGAEAAQQAQVAQAEALDVCKRARHAAAADDEGSHADPDLTEYLMSCITAAEDELVGMQEVWERAVEDGKQAEAQVTPSTGHKSFAEGAVAEWQAAASHRNERLGPEALARRSAIDAQFITRLCELKVKLPVKKANGPLPQAATAILRDWFRSHKEHPYPSNREKQQLAAAGRISDVQVNNWFINQRARDVDFRRSAGWEWEDGAPAEAEAGASAAGGSRKRAGPRR